MNNEWISVQDQPLTQNTWVMGYCTHTFGWYDDRNEIIGEDKIKVVKLQGDPNDISNWSTSNNTCGCCNCGLVVTHWMPLPEPPKK